MPHLISVNELMYMEVTPQDGIIMNNSNNLANQLWEFIPENDLQGVYQIQSTSNRLFLTYHGHHGSPVTLHQPFDAQNLDYQRWRVDLERIPFRVLTYRDPHRCLDVCNAIGRVGRHVIEWNVRNRGNLDNQFWQQA